MRSKRILLINFFVMIHSMLVVQAQSVSEIILSSPNEEALWSVSVRDTNGALIESWNDEKLITPASNQKLYTTGAALARLGSDFTYTTKILGMGELIDSVWHGDLIIIGKGDPTISGTLYNDDRYFVFRNFRDQLKAYGIRKLDGRLLAGTDYFDEQVYPKGWDWDDLSFYYGVEVSALSFNNNAVDLVVRADGEVGQKPGISWFPENTSYVTFVNDQIIDFEWAQYHENYRRDPGSNRIVLASFLPRNYVETESLSVFDAPGFFLDSFSAYLNKHGIANTGEYEVLSSPPSLDGFTEIAAHTSFPLTSMIDHTNKESDNFYAEMLTKTLAAEATGNPGSFDVGVDEIRNFLGELKIDTTFVIMKDGSGMSSGNFTTTSVMSDFLYKMSTQPYFEAFYHSFPVAGKDGSLSYRMRNSDLTGNFVGKTGYVTGARTLSGYLTTRSGRMLSISLATNHFIGKVRPIDSIHEQILQYLFDKY